MAAKTIVIFSTKGGVGKTLIATNLAVSLALDQNKQVCLMDLDLLVAGDMARMLNLTPKRAAVDLISLMKKEPQKVRKEDFVTRSYTGIDFLAGVLKPQQTAHFDSTRIKEMFALFSQDYDYIVVDAGKSFSDTLVSVLNQAHVIFLVVTPDILSIYQTKWTLDTLQFLHFPLTMIKVILNRAESLSSFSWQDIKANLPVDIIVQIPSEGKVAGQSVNKGVPVVVDNPRSRIAVAIKKFTSFLATDDSLFISHVDVANLQMKDEAFEQPREFWQTQGMAEPLSALDLPDEGDDILVLKRKIHNRLIEELNLKRMDLKAFSDPKKARELRDKAEIMIANFLTEEAGSLISSLEVRRKLVKEMLDEALGLGPLEDLLADPSITDIMVNNKDEIYIEKHGKIEFTSKKFISNDQVKTTIERILAPIGRRIDESMPMVDARLADGSRVNAIVPPLALTGPALTIRKFRKERFKTEELIKLGTVNFPMIEFIKACVVCRKNIIVSGGTGSGKTTVLNILSAFIPDNERIVTIEDSAELKLSQEHWVRLESRPPNIEGKGSISIRELFRNTLRMRPDRIIIGECRGLETLDMLQAMNTGHDGSMTTIHANSTHDVISRLDSMILMSGVELPVRAIREMISSAVDLIIHTARLSDGTRKIMQVTELVGMKDETHIDMRDIFAFKQVGVDAKGGIIGDFHPTGYLPLFLEEIKMKGIPLSDTTFQVKPS